MRYFLIIVSLILFLPVAASDYPLQEGDKVYAMPMGDSQTLPLWTHVPEGMAKDAPVVVVMHGMSRDADRYLSQWREISDYFGFYLLVPEFSEQQFPGSRSYNLGNMRDESGGKLPSSQWSFSRIEEAFDYFRGQVGFSTNQYVMYGHSAGAQFVHRFMYFVPGARVETYVAANAGWYTLPDFLDNWPYGLRRTEVKTSRLKTVLGAPLLVLLGDQDTDEDHPSLRKTTEAMGQGSHRLARGITFYRIGRGQSERLETAFNWEISTVPGVGHDNRGMAVAAANYLFAARP